MPDEIPIPAVGPAPAHVPGAIPVPLPVGEMMPAPTAPGGMYDSTAQAFEQGFQRAHQTGLATMERETAGNANVAEQTRLGFLEMKTGADIAESILNQRSVQNQPQVSVVPKA